MTCQFQMHHVAGSPRMNHSRGLDDLREGARAPAPGRKPMSSWKPYESANEMPMAVISAVSRGFSRSGR